MKKTRLQTLLILITCSTILFSCKKDPVDDNKPNIQKKCYVTKSHFDDPKNYNRFVYDNNMRTDSIKSYVDGDLVVASKYIYDASGKVTTEETYIQGNKASVKYVDYNADNTIRKISLASAEGENTEEQSYTVFTYNSNKKVEEAKTFGMSFSGQMLEMQRFTFTWDANGNIIHAEEFIKTDDGYELVKASDYEYDSKSNVMQESLNLTYLMAFSQNRNNIVKETVKDMHGNYSHNISSVCTYSAEGNLTSRVNTFSSQAGNTHSYTEHYEYTCK